MLTGLLGLLQGRLKFVPEHWYYYLFIHVISDTANSATLAASSVPGRLKFAPAYWYYSI
jgi:hypothetical protein